jgi:hypothetical protein
MLRLVQFVMVVGLLSSMACAQVALAPRREDQLAKQFISPPRDVARIYVYRNEGFGAAVRMKLFLDGVPAGETGPFTYTVLSVRPGEHTLVSRAENDSQLNLSLFGGYLYFVWQEVKMGSWYARSELHLVGWKEGREGVMECNLIYAMPPPLPPLPSPPWARDPAEAPKRRLSCEGRPRVPRCRPWPPEARSRARGAGR